MEDSNEFVTRAPFSGPMHIIQCRWRQYQSISDRTCSEGDEDDNAVDCCLSSEGSGRRMELRTCIRRDCSVLGWNASTPHDSSLFVDCRMMGVLDDEF